MKPVPAAALAFFILMASAGPTAEAGPPRYTTSGPIVRIGEGAPVRDDFEAAAINQKLWRVWHSDPQKVRLEQKQGRFWIHARGEVGYNGLASRVDMPTRDVVAICRMGIASEGGGLHAALLHVCGSGPLSPDHWFELMLRATREGAARATIGAAVPPEMNGGYRGVYDLPAAGSEGHLGRVICEGSTNQCRGFVRVGPEWWQVGEPFEVPARRTHLEIKTSGPDVNGATTTIWFDDCRLYPRPETHYVTVILEGPDGRPPGESAGPAGEASCIDKDDQPIPDCGFTVSLYAEDGTTLVARTRTGAAYGHASLSLRGAPWDTYPAAAIIRVHAGERQLGPDHVIRSAGVEGLYPDDVYRIGLR